MTANPFELRGYQQDAVRAVSGSWASGFKAPLIVMPTGGGKTVVFAEIVRKTPGRSLVLAHRQELISQAANKIERHIGVRPGVEAGGARAAASDAVVIATVQTLAKGRPIAGEPFALTIIDEAHHAVLDGQYAKAIEASGAPRLLGVTATGYRADKRSLSAIFDDNPYSLSMLDLIELARETGGREGLCDVTVRTLPVRIDMADVHVRQGDFVAGEVAEALEPQLAALADVIATQYPNAKLLTFCPLRATSRTWTELLQARGLAAAHVQGDSPDRAEILSAFDRNEIRFLSNSNVLTEGYDQPDIDTILMLRPTKSRGLFAQMVGRGTRLFPGKDGLLILDPLFVAERHNVLGAASLIAGDDAQEAAVAKRLAAGRSLTEAVAEANAEQKAKLAEALAGSGKRAGYEKRLAELALELDFAELQAYEPVMRWHGEKPSAAQLAALEKAGISPAAITCKGLASEVLGKLAERREKGLATIKQVRFARRLGHPEAETLSFVAATSWINERMARASKTKAA